MATCPECDAEVEVHELDTDVGDEVSCPECGQNLIVSSMNPIELDFADEEDEEDDTKKGDDDLDDDADVDDEDDEEREDGDWEE